MRKIKFRAYYKPLEKMFYNAWRKPVVKNGEIVGFRWFGLDVNGRVIGLEEDSTVIMQYTGLKDKNGQEIYEGDILAVKDYITESVTDDGRGPKEYFNHITQVYYSTGQWLINIRESGDIVPNRTLTLPSLIFDLVGKENVEVIGNKYENPELLEGESNE